VTKIGIIRCNTHSENCAGYKCFPALGSKAGSFAAYEDDLELVGFDTCGGCGRNEATKIVARAMRLREKGAEIIHLGNCLAGACPWLDLYQSAIARETGLAVALKTHP
jgi:predicted metal-binding protein